jgi:hypothetical protein
MRNLFNKKLNVKANYEQIGRSIEWMFDDVEKGNTKTLDDWKNLLKKQVIKLNKTIEEL